MLEEEFLSMVEDVELKETVTPIFRFFEPNVNKKLNKPSDNEMETTFDDLHDEKQDESYLFEYRKKMIDNKINEKISSLRKQVRTKNYDVLESLVISLQTNTNQFMMKDKYITSKKMKKILYSYINMTRIMPNIEKLEAIRKGADKITKVLLGLSLVDINNDTIRANDEVDSITKIMQNNLYYVVLPMHGCTVTIFETILKKFPNIDIIHVTGHGIITKKDIQLKFVGNTVKYSGFKNLTKKHQFSLAFLNCCYTLEFTGGFKISNTSYSILHEDKVYVQASYSFAENFYTMFNYNQHIVKSWDCAVQNCNENPLKYTLKIL